MYKKETGQNFKNYLIEVRMKAAVKLLMESDVTSYHLANAVGYKDVKTFVEKFRGYYGENSSEDVFKNASHLSSFYTFCIK